jgi:amidohydrolase
MLEAPATCLAGHGTRIERSPCSRSWGVLILAPMQSASADPLLARAFRAIDARSGDFVELAKAIEAKPELGFFEHNTASLVREQFERMDIPYESGLARTGVKGDLRGSADHPRLAIIGELDALLLPEHPQASPEGVAHACGHNVQVAAMVASGCGLREVIGELDGSVSLFAVPAEECIDLPRRMELREAGELHCLVGKAELIRSGAFDDVDMAIVTHTANGTRQRELASVGASLTGAVLKRAVFEGKAVHAGAAPDQGVNAFKAATIACAALDALRAAFPDGRGVRINESITVSNASLSIIPARATVDAIVRARTVESLRAACDAFDRSMRAGAVALQAGLEITTDIAYFPQGVDDGMRAAARDAFGLVLGPENVNDASLHLGASSDLGDVGLLMPVVQPRIGGVSGDPHTAAYRIVDYELAVISSAKAMTAMAIGLLREGAAVAKQIIDARGGDRLSRDQYLELRAELERS